MRGSRPGLEGGTCTAGDLSLPSWGRRPGSPRRARPWPCRTPANLAAQLRPPAPGSQKSLFRDQVDTVPAALPGALATRNRPFAITSSAVILQSLPELPCGKYLITPIPQIKDGACSLETLLE